MNKQFIGSKFFILIFTLLVLILGSLKFTQYQQQKLIEKERKILIAQSEKLFKKNQELQDTLSYLNSTEFKEKTAREQLNMKKADEIIFSFPEQLSLQPQTENKKNDSKQNIKDWVQYFNGK